MIRIRILPAVLICAILSAICLPAAAQETREEPPTPLKLMRTSSVEDNFPVPAGKVKSVIEYRSADQISVEDRELAAKSQPKIAEKATFWGLDSNAGTWTEEQVMCPALPNHLFLRFARRQGAGDVSAFTVSIARNGGVVRLIPLMRRGYSLYSPAAANVVTVSTFNHILEEEKPAQAGDWLPVGLCYAALAGTNPLVDFPDPANEQPKSSFPAWTSVVMIPVAGGAVVQFTDIASRPQPMQWTLTFDAKGKLLKVAHLAETALKVMKAQPETEEPVGTPTRSKVDDDPGVPVKRTPDSGVPDGAVRKATNTDSLPAPKQ